MATDLYRRAISHDYGDEERRALMEQVWSGTPWMVDAFTGNTDDDRCRKILDWCRKQLGPEAWPIHGKAGTWHRGGATVHGWTWFGFSHEADMKAFLDKWGDEPQQPGPKPRP